MLAEFKLKMELSKQRLECLSNEKCKIEDEIKSESNNLQFLKNQIDKAYSILKKFNNRDQQIYIEKCIYGWSNDKISAHHYGINRSSIWKIVNKINKEFEKK